MAEGTTNSLISIGELSKPVDTLVKKISNAVGVLYEPTHTRRMAKARADAAMLEASPGVPLKELRQRAMDRWVNEETRKQQNIEAIISEAIPLIESEAKTENVDDDWLANFFDKCRLTSAKQMQEVWAKILAGEANAPGAFSPRTVALVATLTKRDIALLELLRRTCVEIPEPMPMVFRLDDESPAPREGLNYEAVIHLEALGILKLDDSTSFFQSRLDSPLRVDYFTHSASLNLAMGELPLGMLLITEQGSELMTICSPNEPIEGLWDEITNGWVSRGRGVMIDTET